MGIKDFLKGLGKSNSKKGTSATPSSNGTSPKNAVSSPSSNNGSASTRNGTQLLSPKNGSSASSTTGNSKPPTPNNKRQHMDPQSDILSGPLPDPSKRTAWTVQHASSNETRTPIPLHQDAGKCSALNDAALELLTTKGHSGKNHTASCSPPSDRSRRHQKVVRAARGRSLEDAVGTSDVSMQMLQLYDDLTREVTITLEGLKGEDQHPTAAAEEEDAESTLEHYNSIFAAAGHGCLSGWHGIVSPLLLYRLLATVEMRAATLKALLHASMTFAWSVKQEGEYYQLSSARSAEERQELMDLKELRRFEFRYPWKALAEDLCQFFEGKGISNATVTAASTTIHSMEIFQRESSTQQMVARCRGKWLAYYSSYEQYATMQTQYQALQQQQQQQQLLADQQSSAGMTVIHRVEQANPQHTELVLECEKETKKERESPYDDFIVQNTIDKGTTDEEPPSSLPRSNILNRRQMILINEEENTMPIEVDEDIADGTEVSRESVSTTVGYVSRESIQLLTADGGLSGNPSFAKEEEDIQPLEETTLVSSGPTERQLHEVYARLQQHFVDATSAPCVLSPQAIASSESDYIPLQWADAQRADVRLRVVNIRRKKRVQRTQEWHLRAK